MSTETAQNRPETTDVPLGADEIDHDAAYGALRRLHRVGWEVRDTVVATLRADRAAEYTVALQEAHDLLFPPPLPQSPENARVLYAYAVRLGDNLCDPTSFALKVVREIRYPAQDEIEFLFHDHLPPVYVDRDAPVIVFRDDWAVEA